MTENKLPPASELQATMLEVLRKTPDGLTTKDLDDAVAVKLGLSKEMLSVIRTGNRTEFAYRLAWERTHAKNKGFIQRTGHGTWRISEVG